MCSFSCVLWAIFLVLFAPVLRQIARYLPHHKSENASKTHPKSSHHKSENASKTHPKSSHDKFKTASKNKHQQNYL